MAQKVDAKKAMKPLATPMSRLANQPKSPMGTPKMEGARGAGFAVVGEKGVIQLE